MPSKQQEDPDGGWKNEQITTALWDELIVELTGLCRVAAEVNILFRINLSYSHYESIFFYRSNASLQMIYCVVSVVK